VILSNEQDLFSLENFEGPLAFLLHLVQKKEIDIYDVDIQKLTDQYLTRLGEVANGQLEGGSEFIGTTSSLLLYKSRKLLPDHDGSLEDDAFEEADDPHFDVIHHLIDYCRFREAAKELSSREQRQCGVYYRGLEETPNPGMTLGIEHLSLDDLNIVFEQALEKAASGQRTIEEEEWRVHDKIRDIRSWVRNEERLSIHTLLAPGKSRNELIVTFLAMLELIKIGDIAIIRESATGHIWIIAGDHNENA